MGRDEVLRLPGHRGIGFSPDGSLLAMEVVAGDRFCVGIWSMVERRFTARFAWHNCPINCVTFSPDGKSLATGSFDGAARLWDPRTGTELLAIRAQVGEMGSLTFTPDGTSLVTGGNDGTVNFWDVVSGQQRLSLSGLAGATKMLAFTPDGRILITGQSYPETASPVIVRWDAVETIHSE
jgi:WD40 repeat protein